MEKITYNFNYIDTKILKQEKTNITLEYMNFII